MPTLKSNKANDYSKTSIRRNRREQLFLSTIARTFVNHNTKKKKVFQSKGVSRYSEVSVTLGSFRAKLNKAEHYTSSSSNQTVNMLSNLSSPSPECVDAEFLPSYKPWKIQSSGTITYYILKPNQTKYISASLLQRSVV